MGQGGTTLDQKHQNNGGDVNFISFFRRFLSSFLDVVTSKLLPHVEDMVQAALALTHPVELRHDCPLHLLTVVELGKQTIIGISYMRDAQNLMIFMHIILQARINLRRSPGCSSWPLASLPTLPSRRAFVLLVGSDS